MSKKLTTFGILLIILGGALVPTTIFADSSATGAAVGGALGGPVGFILGGFGSDALNGVVTSLFEGIGYVLTTLTAGALALTGLLFDLVVEFTVIDMAKHLGAGGLGESISQAWATLRDVANMIFIFVLLYAAFRAMFETSFSNFGNTVKNIIIVALLINFSLFFTKVVIDASNVVAVGFYRSITTANVASVGPGSESGEGLAAERSISEGYMRLLNLQSWHDPKILEASGQGNLEATDIIIVGIMSSLFFLITAVIFLISAVMLVARFIILIFIMILSPLALIAYIIPGQDGQFHKWKNALISQSFFAPLFFALTWVALKIASNPGFLGAINSTSNTANASYVDLLNSPKNGLALVLNYVIVIGFSIAALVFAKQVAAKTPYFGKISGGLGAAGAGALAWAGRQTVGRGGQALADWRVVKSGKGSGNVGIRSLSRLGSYVGTKAGSSSFDVRNAAVPTSVVGDTIRGTVGRTKLGKRLGLDDVNTKSIDLGGRLGADVIGTAEKKGYAERREESRKRVREREATEAGEIRQAESQKAIAEGKDATIDSLEYGAMEKALAKMSEKETETLVASNEELLKSQNFANMISVKQLEALNRSDQLSDQEKGNLNNLRFSDINTALTAGGTIPQSIVDKIKSLSDSEIEMMSPEYFDPATPKGRQFIENLKAGQVESIIKNKNGKFTSSQTEAVKQERIRPLITGNSANIERIVKRANIKTRVGYMKIPGRGGVNIALDPAVLATYNPKTLSRMAAHDDMTDNDISTLRAAIVGALPPTHPTVLWLNDPNKGMVEFPP